MAWMGWVFDLMGFPHASAVEDLAEAGKLTSDNVPGRSDRSLQCSVSESGAVSIPGGDAAGQDALHSAVVEGFQYVGVCAEFPQAAAQP